ncbi:MAG: zinc-dependent alcohol dehydrogenase family protein [Bacteroidota bacterium]
MNALYYETFQGPISYREVPSPDPNATGVIIKVKATGLCLSDWHGWMGHDKDILLPHVPGHELAGVVVETGKEVRKFHKGDRVTVPFVGGCGRCSTCLSGNHQVCPDQFQPGFTAWGSFAEYVAIDYADTNLVKLPEEIDYVTAASLGCRFATSFRGVVDQGRVRGGEWVVVFGCGGVGLSAIMIAHGLGAQVLAVDIADEKLAFAQSLGAHAVLNSQTVEDVPEAICEMIGGGAHLTVDAIGNQSVVQTALLSLGRRGRHVQIGILPPEKALAPIPMDRVIAYELELYGSHGMQAFRYHEMLQMILSGRLSPQQLVTETVSLESAAQLLPKMHKAQQAGVRVITI